MAYPVGKRMSVRILWLSFALLLTACGFLVFGQTPGTVNFALPPKGVFSATTMGGTSGVTVGYASVSQLSQLFSGMAVLDFRQNSVLVSQAAIPINRGYLLGRFYARVGGNMNAAVAIATAGGSIQYDARDVNGVVIKSGVFTVPPGGQLSAFLDQSPFNVAAPFEGTVTLTAQGPTPYITAFRTLTNERGEFLFTPVPITDNSFGSTRFYIPHFADGGGWSTEVVLVNPGGTNVQTGVISIFGASVSLAPLPMVVYTYRRDGITVTETSTSPAVPPYGTLAYFYAEAVGDISRPEQLPHQTGLAIFNAASNTPVTVTVELTRTDGSSAGTGSLTLRNGERTSLFLTQIPGLESLQTPFSGMVVVNAPDSKALHVLAIRGTYNEHGDFLVSTSPVIFRGPIDLPPYTWAGTVFPHFAFGSGYTTQFVLFASNFVDRYDQPGPAVSGTLRFTRQDGTTVMPPLQ
jgi:hypothetical protein